MLTTPFPKIAHMSFEVKPVELNSSEITGNSQLSLSADEDDEEERCSPIDKQFSWSRLRISRYSPRSNCRIFNNDVNERQLSRVRSTSSRPLGVEPIKGKSDVARTKWRTDCSVPDTDRHACHSFREPVFRVPIRKMHTVLELMAASSEGLDGSRQMSQRTFSRISIGRFSRQSGRIVHAVSMTLNTQRQNPTIAFHWLMTAI